MPNRGIARACAISQPLSRLIVRRAPGQAHEGRLRIGSRTVRCALGRSGLTAAKREGDGATPRGDFALRRVWWRPDRFGRPVTGLPARRTARHDGWCDDPRSGAYNRPIRLPATMGHERMWREDRVYDAVIEIGWNDRRPVPGRGSAIFLHLARPGFTPTEGCIAIDRHAMRFLLSRIGPATRIIIGRAGIVHRGRSRRDTKTRS